MTDEQPGQLYTNYRWENGWPSEELAPVQVNAARQDTMERPVNPEREEASMEDGDQVGQIPTQNATYPEQVEETRGRQSSSIYTGTSYATSVLSDSDDDISGDSDNKLGGGYIQCRAARESISLVMKMLYHLPKKGEKGWAVWIRD